MCEVSRFGARALLLLAAAAAAYASDQQVPIEKAAWAGVKLVHFIFAAIGAALMVTTKPLGWVETISTFAAGVGVGVILTPYLVEKLSATPALENLVAGLLGAVGLYIVLGVKRAGQTFASNPFAAVDWWRKGGPPPADPTEPREEPKP